MQIKVVRHDDSSNNANSLQQHCATTVFTPWEEHSFQHLTLVWRCHHILKLNYSYCYISCDVYG